ncbi:uncharacterized protein EAF01_003894 [Botrytis porri]|uniref:uncharacterized protein n=1 Tax=Botrytis porri TaxID=87229 RepID=UPI0019000022|nr:uncharacterized protein EAF01_003894 [Botrytis porri]KAF7908139.1 hypothetical protein EAF01_003894 [Botrytis porri]
MAAAPREGIAWFLKESLKSPGYDGEKPEDFYSWMLLEVVYNATEDEAWALPPPLAYPNHPRTGQQVFAGSMTSTGYGRYEFMTAMYGPSAEDIKRTYRLKCNISRGQLWRQTGSAAVCYVAVPRPTKEERFFWVDLTYPIRAIYIPCAFNAHPQYKSHAIFSRLDVRGRKGMPQSYVLKNHLWTSISRVQKAMNDWNNVRNHNWAWGKEMNRLIAINNKLWALAKEAGSEGPFIQEPGLTPGYVKADGKAPSPVFAKVSYAKDTVADDTTGLGMRPQWTLRIDVFKFACQLLVPYKDRTEGYKDLYACFALFDRSCVHGSRVIADIDMAQSIDWAKAQGKEAGLKIEYVTEEPDEKFIKDLFVGFIAVGLGFIPVIGPLVAFGFTVTYELLENSEKFTKAAGVGGKAPAFTQACVDSREGLKPIVKAGLKAVFKGHLQAAPTKSIQVDTGEEKVENSDEKVKDGDEQDTLHLVIEAGEAEVLQARGNFVA